MEDVIASTLGVLGFFLAVYNTYCQHRKTPPLIALQRSENPERCVLLSKGTLPVELASRFPAFEQKLPGCLVFSLIWGNSGDRMGLVEIRSINPILSEDLQVRHATPDAIYYNFIVIPGHEVVRQEVIVWNLPEGISKLDLTVEYGCGAPEGSTGHFKTFRSEIVDISLQILSGKV